MSEADHTHFASEALFTPFLGWDVHLELPIRGGLDARWSEKAH